MEPFFYEFCLAFLKTQLYRIREDYSPIWCLQLYLVILLWKWLNNRSIADYEGKRKRTSCKRCLEESIEVVQNILAETTVTVMIDDDDDDDEVLGFFLAIFNEIALKIVRISKLIFSYVGLRHGLTSRRFSNHNNSVLLKVGYVTGDLMYPT